VCNGRHRAPIYGPKELQELIAYLEEAAHKGEGVDAARLGASTCAGFVRGFQGPSLIKRMKKNKRAADVSRRLRP
jgi:hypothetical protein